LRDACTPDTPSIPVDAVDYLLVPYVFYASRGQSPQRLPMDQVQAHCGMPNERRLQNFSARDE
jgi:hypothetical protein